MGKAVATKADVTAEPSKTVPKDATTGSGKWTAGAITVVEYDLLTIGGKPAISKAECTFTYAGGTQKADSTKPYPTTTEKVTLTAGTTLLQKGASSVLVDGDSKEGSEKNKLSISANHKLTTA
jgi:hypothetical protein